MISNMESQLKGQGAADRLQEVLEEVPRVRRDSGYPPLVTPSSQIVGSQAVFNVLMGQYKAMTGEFADLMLGYYGSMLGEKNPEVLAKAEAHAKKPPITGRPADLLKPEWDALTASAFALEGCNGSDEDVLTAAMFPQVASKFFKTRSQGPTNLGKDPVAVVPKPAAAPKGEVKPAAAGNGADPMSPVTYVVLLHGQEHKVTVTREL
jgi:methylmalonyl-CoA carboxyltransferase 5S subunit